MDGPAICRPPAGRRQQELLPHRRRLAPILFMPDVVCARTLSSLQEQEYDKGSNKQTRETQSEERCYTLPERSLSLTIVPAADIALSVRMEYCTATNHPRWTASSLDRLA